MAARTYNEGTYNEDQYNEGGTPDPPTEQDLLASMLGRGEIALTAYPLPTSEPLVTADFVHALGFYRGLLVVTPPIPPAPPTDDQIAAMLSGRYGSVYTPTVRASWLNASFVYRGDVSDAIYAAEVDLDNFRKTVRTARMRIRPDALPTNFNLDRHYVSIAHVFYEPQTDQEISFQLGIFKLDEPEEEFDEDDYVWIAEAADPSIKLLSFKTSAPLTVPAGTNVVEYVTDALQALGLFVAIDPSTSVLLRDRTFDPYTPYMEWINELLDAINYFDIFVDRYGYFRSRFRLPQYQEQVTVTYSTEHEPRMIVPRVRRRRQTDGIINTWIIKQEDPAIEFPAASKGTNNDPASPVSVALIGQAITQETNGDIIVNPVDNIEWYLLNEAGRTESLTMRTYPDPRREAHETYRVEVGDHIATTPVWTVDGWRYSTRAGALMEHTLSVDPELTIDHEAVV